MDSELLLQFIGHFPNMFRHCCVRFYVFFFFFFLDKPCRDSSIQSYATKCSIMLKQTLKTNCRSSLVSYLSKSQTLLIILQRIEVATILICLKEI